MSKWKNVIVVGFLAFLITACSGVSRLSPSYMSGGPLTERLKNYDLEKGDEVLIRIFKEEAVLEVWMKPKGKTQYIHFSNYPICNYSGELGPKVYEGDYQSPEGFYRVDRRALNPHSRFYKSFNLGYPNAFDRSHLRTGSYLMVHGKCDSVGCYAMTDPQIEEIYGLVEMALKNGQPYVEVQAYPFKMERDRLSRERNSKHYSFWQNLQEGYHQFESKPQPLNYSVHNRKYQFTR